jgi:hypothetical protein
MNPMLRAAHLSAGDPTRTVMLVVPWLDVEQQQLIFPPGLTFDTREQQAEYILKGECSSVHTCNSGGPIMLQLLSHSSS